MKHYNSSACSTSRLIVVAIVTILQYVSFPRLCPGRIGHTFPRLRLSSPYHNIESLLSCTTSVVILHCEHAQVLSRSCVLPQVSIRRTVTILSVAARRGFHQSGIQ